MYATCVELKLVVASQQAFLDVVEVDWLAVDDNETHAPLECQRGVPAARDTLGRGTT